MGQKKITVIGGSGFVGTNLCRELATKQYDFEIIDLKQSKQFPEKCKIADIRDAESLRQSITGDVVINLAAVHRDDISCKSEYSRTNIDGTENVANICREKGIKKIIFTSSVAVYGFADPNTAEDGRISPFNEYGRSKFEGEEKLRAWQASGNNSLIIVRPTVIFGEGNRGNVYNLLRQIASGRFIMIGAGSNIKSIAYIGNVVAFLETCIKTNEKTGLYNYVDKPDLTMNELVRLVRSKLLGKTGVGPRVPYWLGLIAGFSADIISRMIGRSLAVSSIRIKKFSATTQFLSTADSLDEFVAPFGVIEAIDRTLHSEFVAPDPTREIFFTE